MSTVTIIVTDQQSAEQAFAAALAFAELLAISLMDLQTVLAQSTGGPTSSMPLPLSSSFRTQSAPTRTGGDSLPGPPRTGNPLSGPQGGSEGESPGDGRGSYEGSRGDSDGLSGGLLGGGQGTTAR